MSETKLKPCPFCGGEVEMSSEKVDAIREVYNFHCDNCDMVTFYDFPNDREKTIKTWNTRKPIDDILAELSERKVQSRAAGVEMSLSSGIGEITDKMMYGRFLGFDAAIDIVKKAVFGK